MQAADLKHHPHLNKERRSSRLAPVIVPDQAPLSGAENGHPYPKEYEGHLGGVLIKHKDILDRTARLAKLLNEDYGEKRPVFVCVLKGASMFFHQLLADLQLLEQGYTFEFLRAQSYVGDESTGNVKLSGLDYSLLNDKHVIIVEDIVDTGATLAKMIPILEKEGKTKSIEVCTLLEKRIDHERHRKEIPARFALIPKYCGFSIPNEFIVGYGMDYNEIYRDLKDIWVMSKAGIEAGGEI